MIKQTINEQDLHAFVDGQLDAVRRAEIEVYLKQDVDAMKRVEAYRKQNEALRALLDPTLREPVPARLEAALAQPRRFVSLRYAAMAASLFISGFGGWLLRGAALPDLPPTLADLPHQAAVAYAVYSPEVLHPVEVGADQEQHLVEWLSKRLGTTLRIPDLVAFGYHLVGGRLLPGDQGPAAQFMYQNTHGTRLTLYVTMHEGKSRDTAFRYTQENGVNVLYWIEDNTGFALSGETDQAALLKVAHVVYRELGF